MWANQEISLRQVILPRGLAPGEALEQSLHPWVRLAGGHGEHEQRIGHLHNSGDLVRLRQQRGMEEWVPV